MNKDICIIPVFNRPEYLYYTLHLIREARDHSTLKYVFAVDYGHSPRCISVIHEIMNGLDYELMHNDGSRFREMKQSFNLLSAYRKAATESGRLVYLIEDDIFIGKSFFTAHRQIHDKCHDIFCSIASKLHNYNFITKGKEQTLDPFTYQTATDSVYQSLGVCFHKDVLLNHVLPHAFNGNSMTMYFTNSRRYMQNNFPKHFLGTNFTEQDGLLRRICDTLKMPIAYPDYPRCYHAGIWSYHRFGENVQSWNYEKRLQFIRSTCFDADKMQKYNEYNDVFIADLSIDYNII